MGRMATPILIVAGLFILIRVPAVLADEAKPFIVGEVVTIHSRVLGEDRPLFIYTHHAYGEDQSRYPVAYVLDGEWNFHQASGAVDLLSSRETIPWMIVVGIPNVDRMRDLSPTAVKDQPRSGGAPTFRRFLREEVFPFVEARYRTEPFRMLIGHSLAGLFAVDTFFREPGMFNAYLAVGPYLIWDGGRYLGGFQAAPAAPPGSRRFLSVILGDEPELKPALGRLRALVSGGGADAPEFRSREMAGYDHVTVFPSALARGLLDIFPDWRLPQGMNGMEALRRHYAGLTRRYGYEIRPVYFVVVMLAEEAAGRGDIDEAIRLLDYAVELNPDLPSAYAGLGSLHRRRGNPREARRFYEKVLQLAPGDAEALQALAETKD